MAQDNRSAGSTPKPNYNKHFPRSFLLNYGEALQDLPDDKILARLKNWNCEWLSRPNIAMSEMASTLKEYWDNISRFKGTGFTSSFVNQLETFCRPIMPALRRLDNKDRYVHDPPDKDDILDVIEAIHKDDQTETLFTEAFNACGPVLMMAIHILAFNCLLHNPEALAEQSVKNNSTDALRANPSKQAVNQYLIDSILQKRRSVQRSDNLWDRSLYNSATDTPPKQTEHNRQRRLDTQDDDDCTPGTSGSSTTPRRRLTTVPDFAKPPPPSGKSPVRKRPGQDTRQALPLSREREDAGDQQPTQLYARPLGDRRSRTLERRTAARHLPTTFEDDDEDVEQHRRNKGKTPLVGPPTAKNQAARNAEHSTESESEEEQQPSPKRKTEPKPPAKKPRKKPPTVVSSDSDLDDDQLGITPRTLPQSPFYRGRATTSTVPATTKKNKPPSTSTSKPTDRKDKTKHVSSNAKNAEQPQTSDRTKKKNKKARPALANLADEQDKLYAELNKTARNSK